MKTLLQRGRNIQWVTLKSGNPETDDDPHEMTITPNGGDLPPESLPPKGIHPLESMSLMMKLLVPTKRHEEPTSHHPEDGHPPIDESRVQWIKGHLGGIPQIPEIVPPRVNHLEEKEQVAEPH